MRADVLVACSFCGLCLMLEAPKECLGDVPFEFHAWILCNHSRPEIFGKRLVSDTEHIQTDSVVQELHLQWLVRGDTGCCVWSDCVPGGLDPSGGHTTLFEKQTSRIGTVHFKTIRRAAELLEQSEVVECGTDEDELRIERLACMPSKLVRPEEDAMRMVEEQRRTEFPKQAGGFAGQWSVRNPSLHVLKFWCGGRNRQNDLWAAEGRRVLRVARRHLRESPLRPGWFVEDQRCRCPWP